MAIEQKLQRRLRIKHGIRRKINGTAERPRLSVFKSNTAIYAQLIDDINGHTLTYANSQELGKAKNVNVEKSKEVGKNCGKSPSKWD